MLSSVPTATWLGQDGHDLVGPSSLVAPSGVQDIHIGLSSLPAGRTISSAVVRPFGGGEWDYNGPWGPWAAQIVQDAAAGTAELYVEPSEADSGGTPYSIDLTFDDGSAANVWVTSGVVDPNLRMPDAAVRVQWLGQDGTDRVGPGPSVGPDGIQDVHLVLTNLSPSVPIDSIRLDGPAGLKWRTGTNRAAVGNAEVVRRGDDPTTADLYFQPGRDLADASLILDVLYGNNKIDETTIQSGTFDPTLVVAPPLPAPPLIAGPTATWAGQDGTDLNGPGDVRLDVAGIPAGRTVVGAVLNDPANAQWAWRRDGNVPLYIDAFAGPLAVQRGADPSRLVVTFPPGRDETGATLTLRLLLDDGTTAVVPINGGAADPGLRAPGPDASQITAHPGDDLNDLANRFGTVRLTAGTYNLSTPLVLNRPVNLVADPGALLLFTQPATAPGWTAAIKINAAHTHLDGFAVRFAGPVRWRDGINYGPAVIGSTDNYDTGADTLKVDIQLTHLDLQGPPPASAGEEAPRLIRLATAQSGRIENNTLKGGVTEFLNGPWSIVHNDYQGTLPGTFAYAAFAGHRTHDVVIRDNNVVPITASGKTWRFLTLTESGWGDTVEGNTVRGIGPRDNDAIPSQNAPEIILTEAYTLRFEGKPLALSADGRVLQIPAPQGGEAGRTGDVVAILSGPNAGQYRRIAQALGPTTYLLDSPLPAGDYAISIAPGFAGETFRGNTIDATGSSVAVDMFLAGSQFGTQVVGNTFIGGGGSLRVIAPPSERPVSWGWSHTPVFGLVVDGNTQQDVLAGMSFDVEHSDAIKTNLGRVYLSATLTNNTTVWTSAFLAGKAATPPALSFGNGLSIDPGELVVSQSNNRIKPPAGVTPVDSMLVNSGTVDGIEYFGKTFPLPRVVPPAPTGVGLVHDTGAVANDLVTKDGHIRFDAVADAVGYEYSVGDCGVFRSIGAATSFAPGGLVQGVNTILVRAVNDAGDPGAIASFRFTYDNVAPPTPTLLMSPTSDTGRSQADRITRDTSPEFNVTGDATDTFTLFRYGGPVTSRVGPGAIRNTPVERDGFYYYFVSRTDLAGNISISLPVPVLIDTTPPAAVTGVAVGTDGKVSFRPTSPADSFEYRVGASGSFTPIAGSGPFTPAGLVLGRNTVAIRAVDLAGNPGPPTTVNVSRPDPLPPRGQWLGQDGADRVGPSPLVVPDGTQDIHIALAGLNPDRKVAFVDIQGLGGGQWQYRGAWGPWAADLVRADGSTTADLYLEPYQRETGRPFYVTIRYDDGTTASLTVAGGQADPGLKVGGNSNGVGVAGGTSEGGSVTVSLAPTVLSNLPAVGVNWSSGTASASSRNRHTPHVVHPRSPWAHVRRLRLAQRHRHFPG